MDDKEQEVHLLNDDEDYEFTFKKTLEPDIRLEPVTPTKETKEVDSRHDNTAEKRQKLNDGKVKKRLRNLNLDEDELENKHKQHKKESFQRNFPIFKISIFLISTFVLIVAIWNSDKLRNDLIENYQKQYNTLIRGDIDFCTQRFDFKNITDNLRKKLIGQSTGIDEIENQFKRHDGFTSIAIIGNTGVGKTYTTSLIEENFPWNENVQFYVWSMDSGNSQIENIKTQTIKNFSKCGHNLLFIDDLAYEDRNFVQTINEILKRHSKENEIKLIVFYIFNLNKHTEMSQELAKSHADTLRLLQNINVINFENLTSNDIIKCIELISDSVNISLTDYQKMEVLKSVVKTNSGCKNVMAKIFLYS